MAYDFLGSIQSREDFDEFEEFVNIEIKNISFRIDHLKKEQSRFTKVYLSLKMQTAILDLITLYPKNRILIGLMHHDLRMLKKLKQ